LRRTPQSDETALAIENGTMNNTAFAMMPNQKCDVILLTTGTSLACIHA
jgi:hypothetical protein